MQIQVKRIYDRPTTGDGRRVLVDRLWPRGVSRERAELDEWERALAPSPELRRWFGHRPARFAEFRLAYIDELRQQRSRLRKLRASARDGPVTLLYAAHDPDHNHAIVLAEVLRRGLPKQSKPRSPQGPSQEGKGS
ncbi:MAG TPA: DUF488 family protein [Solirubrobacterales bacterium]|nr:DUF488 family protein [Solirubrobacterales bacterium]